MSENLLERVNLLMKQQRYNEAEKMLVKLLTYNPNDSHLLYLLSEISLHQEDYKKSEELINKAITINPEESFYLYTKARIYVSKGKTIEAERYIKESIVMNPEQADYFTFWAHIELLKKQYEEALNIANQALHLDPNNILALNIRSTVLLKLNRKEESYFTVMNALSEDPDNPHTHANHGWGLLEKNDINRALNHFKEALKNDPNSEYAQAGMVEALKARLLVYRWFLNYSFWIGNMTAKYQWAFILGFYFGSKTLQKIARNNENLAPFLYPVVGILFVIAFSTWIINPIGNLFLLLNPFGKHLLSKEEKTSSYAIGISILISLVSGIAYYATNNIGFMTLCIFSFTMMIPFSQLFAKPKLMFISYNFGMLILGIIATIIAFSTGYITNIFGTIYLFGLIGFQFLTNYYNTKV